MTPPHIGERPPTSSDLKQEEEYQRVLALNTSRQELYAMLDTRMFAGMTHQSWAFRQARTRRTAEFQSHPTELVQQNLEKERAEFESSDDFFFGVYLNEGRYEDFDRADSVWRIVLVFEGKEIVPSKIQRIGRSDLNLRAYYPYLDEFWIAYRIRFPKTLPEAATAMVVPPFSVRVASTFGKMEFMFPARPDGK
jgi:hypothetical protein